LGFNFFFLSPLYTLTVADPQNWGALAAFLITAVIAGQLSELAKRRAAEAEAVRTEARLAKVHDRSLLEAGLDALVTLGTDGRINDVNSAIEVLTGRSRARHTRHLRLDQSAGDLRPGPHVPRSDDCARGRGGTAKDAERSKWYAVYVETPQEQPNRIKARDADALQQNIKLAESLGATVVRVRAERPADGLIAFAQREGSPTSSSASPPGPGWKSSGAARPSIASSAPYLMPPSWSCRSPSRSRRPGLLGPADLRGPPYRPDMMSRCPGLRLRSGQERECSP
jgi:PAS domain-containing protein